MAFEFDPQALQQATYEEATSTVRLLLPVGWKGRGIIKNTEFTSGESKKNPGEKFVKLVVNVEQIEGPDMETHIQRKSISGRLEYLCDINDRGMLDMGPGKNVGLGLLREALGMNQPGVPFKFSDMAGKPVALKAGIREDPNDPATKYQEWRLLKEVDTK